MCYFFLKNRGFKDIIFPPVQPFVCQQDQTMWWLSQQSLTGSISILRTFPQSYILVHICFSIPPTHPWQFLLSQQPTGFFSLFNLRRNPENWPNTRNTQESFQKKLKAFSTDPESFGQFRQRLSGARVCISESQQKHTHWGKANRQTYYVKADIWQARSLGCFINNVSNSAALYGENAIWNLQIFSVIFSSYKIFDTCAVLRLGFNSSVNLIRFLPAACLNWIWVYCR